MKASTTSLSGVIAFIGVGSNLGKPIAQCLQAIEDMRRIPGCTVLRRSSFYRTEPVGFIDQDWFINAVMEVRTVLAPQDLLRALQNIEKRLGRKRERKWGPRTIDLDILLHGQEIVEDEALIVPHPEFHRRRFALEPLHEIAPYAIHPVFGISMAGLLARLDDTSRVEKIEEVRMGGRCVSF